MIFVIGLVIYLKAGSLITVNPFTATVGALLFATPLFFSLVSAYKHGETIFGRYYARRSEQPVLFWMHVGLQAVLLSCSGVILYLVLTTNVLSLGRQYKLQNPEPTLESAPSETPR